MKKYFAWMIGTAALVLWGCGAAVFAGAGGPFAPVGALAPVARKAIDTQK